MAKLEHGYGGKRVEALDTISLGEIFSVLERRLRLIVATAAVFVGATFVYVGTRTPTYRASATLMLLEDVPSTGLLADLASLTSSPAAESEMAILRSRSLVEDTVRAPASGRSSDSIFEATQADSVLEGGMRTLGLTDLVQPADLSPFSTMWRRLTSSEKPEHRLLASIDGPSKPKRLTVTFPGRGRVRLSAAGEQSVEVAYSSDKEITAFGLVLRLHALGDYLGRTYQIRRVSLSDAVTRVLDDLRVKETARNSGVISVRVSDSDPHRGAELANALCQNYILRSIRIGSYRASQTVQFVTEQLESQLEALGTAEREVVRLQAENPEVIDMGASARAIIDMLTEFELEQAHASLARTALTEASELVAQGRFDAVARLSQDLPDMGSLTFIQEIGRLTSESLQFARRDSGAFRLMLEQEINALQRSVDDSIIQEAALEGIITRLEAGDASAIMRFPDASSVPEEYVEEFARIDAALGALAGVATAENPEVKALEASRTELVTRVLELVKSARAGLTSVRADREALVESYRSSVDALPGEERGKVDRAISTLQSHVLENLRSRITGLVDGAVALAHEIESLEAQLAALPEAERRIAEPMRRREAFAGIVRFLLQSQQEAQLSAAATMPSAVLIDPAVPSVIRSFPKVVLSLILALLLGTLVGIGLAFVRQNLQGCLYTAAELEEVTGLPVFGTIPDFRYGRMRVKGAGEGYLPLLQDPGGLIAEAYRSIRANLRFALEPDKALRTLAVTSCVPREGKTVTNVDLAMAFAMGGRKVLLVDADMRKPRVHAYFGLSQSPGFAEVLVEGIDWRERIQETPVKGLSVLTAGHYTGPPGESLSTERPGELVDEFLEDFEMVVFDLPPAIIVADVEEFAHKLDALILLYRSGGVPSEAIATAVKRIQASGANLVGSILNAVRPTRSESRSYYGYGYGYGSGRAYGSQEDKSGQEPG